MKETPLIAKGETQEIKKVAVEKPAADFSDSAKKLGTAYRELTALAKRAQKAAPGLSEAIRVRLRSVTAEVGGLEGVLTNDPETWAALPETVREAVTKDDQEDFDAHITELIATAEQSAPVERIARAAAVGKIVERVRDAEEPADWQELSHQELATITSIAERKNWNSIYTLKPGERVAVFTEPTFQSTKRFNDELFGQLKTDSFIGLRNRLLRELLAEKSDKKITVLEQTFKNGFFRIPPDMTGEEAAALLNEVCAELNARLTKEVAALVDDEVAQIQPSSPKAAERAEKLQEFQKEQTKQGYRFGYGVSLVEEDGNEQVVTTRAVAEAWSASLLNREHLKQDTYGGEFSEEDLRKEINENERRRDSILEKNNEIRNQHGQRFVVFIEQPNGTYLFNQDLFRLIRKGSFQPHPEDKSIFALVDAYRKALNFVDIVKPYTLPELAGQTDTRGEPLVEKLAREQEIGSLLERFTALTGKASRTPDEDAERQELAGELSKRRADVLAIIETSRDGVFSSDTVFHHQAMQMSDRWYLALDAIDVGVRGFSYADELFQRVYTGELSLSEALLKAGDRVTEELRAFRDTVRAICAQEYGGESPTLVGGDELTLVLDAKRMSEEQFARLTEKIRSASPIKTRLVATRATREDSRVRTEELTKITEHVFALRRTEAGTEAAKKIERSGKMLTAYAHETVTWSPETRRRAKELADAIKNGFSVMEVAPRQFALSSSAWDEPRLAADVLKAVEIFLMK